MSIQLDAIRKSFDTKVILEDVSLEVPEGETHAVIGASGSGKSVMLKTIVGLLRPDSGDVVVDGLAVPLLAREALYELRRRVGYVFQFAALFDSMTVSENVSMGLRRTGMTTAEIANRVAEALGLVGLEAFGPRLPSELSGGQRKRVGLARAIATHPKYLLYDEPTTGLDPVTTAVIDELILKMRRELGVTSIVVTHDMKSAYRIASRISMLHAGRIRLTGTPEEIQNADDPIVRGFVEGRPDLSQEAA
ncbi:MAG: ABC transporter ATP-binding protein [Longimicrobiales bacterium]